MPKELIMTDAKAKTSYEVEVVRTAMRVASIVVEADSAEEAEILALEMAGGLDFSSEKDAVYEVNFVK
jgi:hypothetical protein